MNQISLSRAHRSVLFIGHDATLTGAPNSLLKIIGWMCKHESYRPLAVLGRGGPMVERYAEVCETHVWEADRALLSSRQNPSRVSRALAALRQFGLARRLYRRYIAARIRAAGPICIFNNTGVTGALVRELSAFHAAPVVSRIPELEGFMRRNSKAGGLQGVLTHSEHFIAVSDAVRRNLEQRYAVDPSRISVVYGACDAQAEHPRDGELRRCFGFGSGDFLVCGCGTMDWRKGFDLFLQCAHRICRIEGRKDIRFLWIGAPVSANTGVEYAYEVELLGLSGSLVLLGPQDAPSAIFAQCDLFFLSSREDPFPLVMLEAARQGLPVICFDQSGGAPEFVEPEFGKVLPMLDVVAAAGEIVARASCGPVPASVAQAARARALQFSVERMGAEVAAVIDRVVSRRAPGGAGTTGHRASEPGN